MIAKLSTWAPDRAGAVEAMARALEDFDIQGLAHNTPFLSAVVDQARAKVAELLAQRAAVAALLGQG